MEKSNKMHWTDGKVPFEEALDRTGFGVYNYILTALVGLIIISFACVAYGSSMLVPASACELDTTGAQQGMLAAAPVIGMILGAVLWGYLGDTYGRRSMLMASLLSAATVNVVVAISVNWIMMLVLQFVASILASGMYTLSMTILSESVPMMRRNIVLLLVTSIFLLAQGIMAVIAIPIIPLSFSYYISTLGIYWNSWRTLVLVYSAPSYISCLWLLFMKESPKFIFNKHGEEASLELLSSIHRINKGKNGGDFEVKGLLLETTNAPEGPGQNKIALLFKPPLLKYTIIMSTLSIFLQVGAFLIWLPTIANQYVQILQTGDGTDLALCGIITRGLEDPADVDPDANPCALNMTSLLMVLSVGGLQSVANLLLSLVLDKAGRRNTVIAVAATTGLCGIIMNLVPNAIGSGILFALFLTGFLCVGLYTSITVALFPTHLRALAVAITMTGGRVMTFASIQLLNFLLTTNCEAGFYIFTTLFAASALVAAFLPDDRLFRKQALEKLNEDTRSIQNTEL